MRRQNEEEGDGADDEKRHKDANDGKYLMCILRLRHEIHEIVLTVGECKAFSLRRQRQLEDSRHTEMKNVMTKEKEKSRTTRIV